MPNVIAYYRVSTKKQGASGLGLDGQVTALEQYATASGSKIVATYKEVESGKRKDRPELAKALAHAKRSKATLVVAKLDRLSRNLAFLSSLMESGVEFVACDNPHASRFTVHILAAVAEHEARMISERTKTALTAAKARGTALGSARLNHWEGREHLRRAGQRKAVAKAAESHTRSADEAYADLVPVIQEMQSGGATLRTIADRLNEMGHSTRRGKAWNASQVMRVLARQS